MADETKKKLLNQLSESLASVDAGLVEVTRNKVLSALDDVLKRLSVERVAITNEATLIDVGVLKHLRSLEDISTMVSPAPGQDPSIYKEWKQRLADAGAGVTTALGIAAETGTILLSQLKPDQRSVSLLPTHHIVILPEIRVVPDVAALFKLWTESGATGNTVMVTGPSRTADIEKELVLGVHGPQSLTVILYS